MTISDSYATGSINVTNVVVGTSNSGIYMGALVAITSTSNTFPIVVRNSYATGNLTATSSRSYNLILGGILGFSYINGQYLSIAGCFVTGTYSIVSPATQPSFSGWLSGGIIAQIGGNGGSSSISNSYSMVSISFPNGLTASTGGFAGISPSISNSYSASPSVTGSGAHGFVGNNPSISNSYLYANGSVPSQTLTGLTSYTTATQMQTQSNFTGFTFGSNSASQNWAMPSANPLAPNGLLSPVQYWQCGTNGITCP